jgi:hypothetical protein
MGMPLPVSHAVQQTQEWLKELWPEPARTVQGKRKLRAPLVKVSVYRLFVVSAFGLSSSTRVPRTR